MKSIELLAIGVRLLGVYLLVNGVRLALKFYQVTQQEIVNRSGEYDFTYAYVGALEVALIFIVAFVMLRFPLALARWITPAQGDNEVRFDGKAGEMETTLLVILGVYILTWATPEFFGRNLWWIYLSRSSDASNADMDMVVINQFVTLMEIAIGLFLCLRANGLAALLRRLRTAGVR